MGRRIRAVVLASVCVVALGGLVPTAAAAAPESAWLSSVSCPTATTCFAVGGSDPNDEAFVMRWADGVWSAVNLPIPGGVDTESLQAVSCAAADRCVAIGRARTGSDVRPFVATWNGVKWTSTTLAMKAQHWTFHGISCPSASMCIAIGEVYVSDRHPFALRKSGSTWALMGAPRTNGSVLDSVSCRTTTSCIAVGRTPKLRPYIVRWNGNGWSTMWSPMPPNRRFALLHDVVCPTATRCFAVGNVSGRNGYGFVLSWNGSGWSLVARTKTGSRNSVLSAISCTSPTNCFATGTESFPDYEYRTIVMRWNGTEWSRRPSPNAGQSTFLTDVACVSATSCHAAGSWSTPGSTQPFAARWDGTNWSRAL